MSELTFQSHVYANCLMPITGNQARVEVITASRETNTARVVVKGSLGSGFWWDCEPIFTVDQGNLSAITMACPVCGEEFFVEDGTCACGYEIASKAEDDTQAYLRWWVRQ